MPVIKCESNGKWRIGQSACIYETKEQAVKVYQAILASGKLKKNDNNRGDSGKDSDKKR